MCCILDTDITACMSSWTWTHMDTWLKWLGMGEATEFSYTGVRQETPVVWDTPNYLEDLPAFKRKKLCPRLFGNSVRGFSITLLLWLSTFLCPTMCCSPVAGGYNSAGIIDISEVWLLEAQLPHQSLHSEPFLGVMLSCSVSSYKLSSLPYGITGTTEESTTTLQREW